MQMRWNYPFLRIDQTLLFETSNLLLFDVVGVVVAVVVVPVRRGRCYCSHWLQRRSFVSFSSFSLSLSLSLSLCLSFFLSFFLSVCLSSFLSDHLIDS